MTSRGFAMQACIARFDASLAVEVAALLDDVPAHAAESIRVAIDSAKEGARQRFEAVVQGRRSGEPAGPLVGSQQAGAHLVPEFGADDAEHPASANARLQHSLTKMLDKAVGVELIAEAGAQGRTHAVVRLRDLSDPSVNHTYLLLLGDSPTGGLSGDDFIIDVRLRLGVSQCDDSRVCGACGRCRFDVHADHAQYCAPGPANAGHNDVRDALFDLVRVADSTAETEALGLLCTAPSLRPADILTSAVSGSPLHALDVTVVAPLAQHAGTEPCDSAVRRKLNRYRLFFAKLQAAGVWYAPLAWTFFGARGRRRVLHGALARTARSTAPRLRQQHWSPAPSTVQHRPGHRAPQGSDGAGLPGGRRSCRQRWVTRWVPVRCFERPSPRPFQSYLFLCRLFWFI